MKRRTFVSSGIGLLAGMAGCASNGGQSQTPTVTPAPTPTETRTPAPTATKTATETPTREPAEDYDEGVVIERELSELRTWHVNAVEGSTIDLTVSGLGGGDVLVFKVGDGTGYVHSDRLYEDRSASYTFESNGQHNVLLYPKRHEAPMNESVTVDVLGEIA